MFNKKLVFIFGRFQVPTKGHAEMIMFGADYARRTGAEYRVYTSQSHDSVKNPLPYHTKVGLLRQLFPGINVIEDPSAKTAFHICRKLSEQGYEDVTMIVGGDRVREFQQGIGKYVVPRDNPKFNPDKNYGFKRFSVINSGARVAGVSGTQMREYIRQNKFAEFMKVAPTKNTMLAKKIFKAAKDNLREDVLNEDMTRKEFDGHLKSFMKFTADKLGFDEMPEVIYKEPDDHGDQPSFGGYAPGEKKLVVMTKNRHPMDIFRTVAHELVHHKQNLDGRLGKDIAHEGSTGSDIENEANSEAGKVMRWFGKSNPDMFGKSFVIEGHAILLGGVPGSGKDKVLKEAILPHGFKEVSQENFKLDECTGENLVVNGTMSGYEQTRQIKDILESAGYKTMMVFVNTSDEVSKQRNESRATKGGRVIAENVRFSKWQSAQINLEKYDRLFEKVIEVKNDFDVNDIADTWSKLMESVSKEIVEFTLSDADRNFEQMLNEVGGAGNWGTPKLTHRYQKDTPGQTIGFRPMKVLRLKNKMKNEQKNQSKGPSPSLQISADRIGQEVGFPKSPGFGTPFDDFSVGISPSVINDPIGRWMVKEETKRRFKEKYGQLAEQKIRETADRLKKAQYESLVDPYAGGGQGATPNSGNVEDIRPDINAEDEKTSLFKRKRKLNNRR